MAINFDEFQSEESTPSSVNFDEFQPIEQKKPVSQVITENIKKLAPSMPQEEALKSPFVSWQIRAQQDPRIQGWWKDIKTQLNLPPDINVVDFMKRDKSYNYQQAIESGALPQFNPEAQQIHWPDINPRTGESLKARTVEGQPNPEYATVAESQRQFKKPIPQIVEPTWQPQPTTPGEALIQPQADPLYEAQQTVKGIAEGIATFPQAAITSTPIGIYGSTELTPEQEAQRQKAGVKPLIDIPVPKAISRFYEKLAPEPGIPGFIGQQIGFFGTGAVLSMIPTLARAMRMKPTEVMKQVVAESKATNKPISEVVKNRIEALGTPTEAEVMAGQAITPEMQPYSPALTGAYAKQVKIPEVKPAEITPTEPKSFRATPEEVKPTGEITPYREGMEEVKPPPEPPPVEAKPTEPIPPTQPEISAGVKEAPTEVSQYHDLQGRPITRGGELLEPPKPPTQVEAQAQMENRITDIDTQIEQLQKKLDLAYGAEMEAGAKRGYAEGMKGRRGGAYKGQATILTKKYGKPEDIQTQITTLQNEKADILKQVGIEPPTVQPEAPSVPKVKQPWEMTKEELSNIPINQLHEFEQAINPEKYKWYQERPYISLDTRLTDFHKESIKTALKQNVPVPPEVLKDYPDLKPSITKEPIRERVYRVYWAEGSKQEGFGSRRYIGNLTTSSEGTETFREIESKFPQYAGKGEFSIAEKQTPVKEPIAKRLITEERGAVGEKAPWEMRNVEVKKQPHYFDSLMRMESGRETRYPFMTDDARIAVEYEGEPTIFPAVQFDNPLYVSTRREASEKLLGKNIYPSGKGKVGQQGVLEKAILDADEQLGNIAKQKGYDAIITPSEVQVLDKSKLNAPIKLHWDPVGYGDWKLEDGSVWTDVSGHREIVKKALAEGKPVPPEVLKDYPDLQKPSIAKRLITEEKGGLTIGGRREELLGKLGEPIELPEKAVNINLKNLDTPDDVKRLITQIGKLYEPEIQEARRGVITHQQTAKLADDLGMTVEELLKRKKGEALNAEELLGARRLLTFSQEEALTKAQQFTRTNSNQDMADALESFFNAVAVQKQVSGAQTETARALNAMKMLAGPEVAREQAMKRIIAQMGGQELTADILKRLGSLDISNPLAVNRFLRDISKATTKEKVYSVWINALLSGLPTHIANDLSNLSSLLIRPFETIAAATYDIPRAAFTGTPRQRFFGEAPADLIGIIQGLPEAGKVFVKSLTTGEPGFIKSTKIDIPQSFLKGKPIKGKLGTAVNAPTSLLQAEDDFFKVLNYRGAVNAYAYREASKQGTGIKGMAKLLSDMPEWLDEAGRAEAVYRTFQKELGKYGKIILRTRDQLPGGKVVAPFVRTPINIPKFALERTPLNLYGVGKQIVKGGGGAISDELAKMTIGSSIMYIMFKKGLDGTVTGGGPANPGERKAWMMTHQPYSIKVGNRWIGYGRLEPIASIMGIAADLAELVNDWDKIDTNDAVSQVSFAIAKNFTSKTFLTGISDIIKVFDDPTTYGEKWATRLGGTVVPGFVAKVTQTIDPTIRRPDNPLEGIEARLPFLSENIPPLRDIWGRPVIMQETGPERFVSPIRRMEIPDDKATSEYVRLGLSASTPAKSFGKIDIASDAYQTYLEQSGEAAHKAVSRLVSKPFYDRLNDMQRSELIKKVMENARKPYRAKMKLETWRKFKSEGGTMKEFMAESRGYLPESLQRPGE